MSYTKSALLSKEGSGLQTFDIDVISDILANCRSWQLKTIFIIYLTKIPTAFFMACIVYTAPVPQRAQIFCKDVTDANSYTKIVHPPIVTVNDKEFDLTYCDTLSDIKDHAKLFFGNEKYEAPWNVPNISRSGIDIHEQRNIIPCDVFSIKSGNSITTYDIMCSRGGLVVLTQGMHLVGIFLSGIVARYLLKVMSPKNVMRMAMLLQIICGNVAGLVQSLTLHLIFRCLAAIGCATAFGAGAVLFSDITSGKLKIAALIFFDIFWSIGIIILSVITKYESKWTELYLIISYPTLMILILTIWIPDSPRWLLRHGDVENAFKIVVNAVKSCHTAGSLPPNLAFKLKLQSIQLMQQRPPVKWNKLWQHSLKTTVNVLLLHVAFACFTILYFGMVLNMPNYGRQHLASSAIFIATSEMVGCCIGYLFGTITKRKFRWSGIFNIIGTTIALCMWFWSNRESKSEGNFVIDTESEFVEKGILLSFCLVLKASVSCSFGVLLAFSADLVKEEMRSTLLFSLILCGRLFLLNAPVIVSLGTFYGEFLSLTLFAIVGAIGGSTMILIDFFNEMT